MCCWLWCCCVGRCCRVLATSGARCCAVLCQLGCLLECEATLMWLQATLWGTSVWTGMGHWPVWCGMVQRAVRTPAVSCSPLLLPAVFAKSANAGITEQPVQNAGSWFGCTAWASSRADPCWMGWREGGSLEQGRAGGSSKKASFVTPFLLRRTWSGPRWVFGVFCLRPWDMLVPFYCVACMRLPSRRLLVCLSVCIDRGVA